MRFSEVITSAAGESVSLESEIRAGYLYFHAAPDARSFHQECVRRVKNLHTADCLRANKCVLRVQCKRLVKF